MTYHAIGEDDANFLDSAAELIKRDAALILNIKKLESLRQELRLFLCRRTFLRQLSLKILLKSIAIQWG